MTGESRGPAGVKWIRLRYRHVNQKEDYQTADMTLDSTDRPVCRQHSGLVYRSAMGSDVLRRDCGSSRQRQDLSRSGSRDAVHHRCCKTLAAADLIAAICSMTSGTLASFPAGVLCVFPAFFFFSAALIAAPCFGFPISFEERDARHFLARLPDGTAELSPDRVTLGGVTLRFLDSASSARFEGSRRGGAKHVHSRGIYQNLSAVS